MSLFYLAYLNLDIQTYYNKAKDQYKTSTAGFDQVTSFHYNDSLRRFELYFQDQFHLDQIHFRCKMV